MWGAAYISHSLTLSQLVRNVEYYAKIVHDCSIRRKLILTAQEMIKSAQDETREGNEIIEESEKKILKLLMPIQILPIRCRRSCVQNTGCDRKTL